MFECLDRCYFKTRFIFSSLNGKRLLCYILLGIVENSTVAEKLREKWKSNLRKDFIRASAGETRNTTDGSINVLLE